MTELLTLEDLFRIINNRIKEKNQNSYSYKLINLGVEKIAKKVGEEAMEVCLAAFKNDLAPDAKSKEDLVGESCDLLYHFLILMAQQGVDLELIKQELARRNNSKKA